MKKAVLFIVLALSIFSLAGSLWAYEGGTKVVATMTHPKRGEAEFSPLLVVPYDRLTPSKPVVGLLQRIPEPTLSMQGIREEGRGPSLGTKLVTRFFKKDRV